jgi:pyruvate/2-oxoacid:ferredoxin oxidoreductase beta subunit
VPCLDGWGLSDDARHRGRAAGGRVRRLPAATRVEQGRQWTLNLSERTRPVADYLALQRRYRHLSADDIAVMQAEVDEGWAHLLRLVALTAAPAAAAG